MQFAVMQQTKVEVVAHSLFIAAQDVHFGAFTFTKQDMEGRKWKDEMAFFVNIL